MQKLSVVITTLNDEDDIKKAITSVKKIASEIIVIDMYSTDSTVVFAKDLGATIHMHEKVDFVEKVRNFGISKAKGDWILIMDPDEYLGKELKDEIMRVMSDDVADYFRIARKNIIFGKWIQHTMWWPDFNIRLFKKGHVKWEEVIHAIPMTEGRGADMKPDENLAIIHNNYKNIDSYLNKMFRYTKVQAEYIHKQGYIFKWGDLITKPLNEFLSRYFAGQGYKDGIHGLGLSLLQAVSELVLYVRLWGYEDYKESNIKKSDISKVLFKSIKDLKWWIRKEFSWLKSLMSA